MILIDNTVLSNFSHIERPDLVRRVLPDACITPQVMEELETGVAAGHFPDGDWNWLQLVELSPGERTHLARLRLILDDGEAASIAVALERGGTIFTDDGDARRYARRRGLPVSGTLGILVLLVEGEHLTVVEADGYLGQMIDYGYRSPVTSLAELKTG